MEVWVLSRVASYSLLVPYLALGVVLLLAFPGHFLMDDAYITLHNALWDVAGTSNTSASPVDIHAPVSSYKLINNLTEAVTAPQSLAYSLSGTHFFAGGQNSISLFVLMPLLLASPKRCSSSSSSLQQI